jgi:exodeoxyribonuclease VII large subunit
LHLKDHLPLTDPSSPAKVSDLLRDLGDWIREGFSYVRVIGELSNLKPHRSGHLYFTLKDEYAQIRGVMFRTDLRHLPFTLEEGMEVVIEGEIELYPPRGELNLIARRIEPVGEGALMAALLKLKERLEKEGLFSPELKRPLPFYPRCVGVVTSPLGAAIRDILKVSRRRHPGIDLIISPTRVQGIGAELEVVEGLRRLYARRPDVIILARGGGSREDLWTFNTEIVVREVAESPVPLVSAVGHESDYTLCDLAADARASTPSSAAEIVFPSREELIGRIRRDREGLRMAVMGHLREKHLLLERFRSGIPTPRTLLERMKGRYELIRTRFFEGFSLSWNRKREKLSGITARLSTLNPLSLLKRGYAIAYGSGGQLLRRAGDVSPGERVTLRLGEGKLYARVEGKEEGN